MPHAGRDVIVGIPPEHLHESADRAGPLAAPFEVIDRDGRGARPGNRVDAFASGSATEIAAASISRRISGSGRRSSSILTFGGFTSLIPRRPKASSVLASRANHLIELSLGRLRPVFALDCGRRSYQLVNEPSRRRRCGASQNLKARASGAPRRPRRRGRAPSARCSGRSPA